MVANLQTVSLNSAISTSPGEMKNSQLNYFSGQKLSSLIVSTITWLAIIGWADGRAAMIDGRTISLVKRESPISDLEPIHRISMPCSTDSDCSRVSAKSVCIVDDEADRDDGPAFKCICAHGYARFDDNNTCVPVDVWVSMEQRTLWDDGVFRPTDEARPRNPSGHMLPIMMVMGVMFIGMCVALNLFSRARFQHNRSIFSNPRLLKLGQKSSSAGNRRKSPPHPSVASIRLVPGLATVGQSLANHNSGHEQSPDRVPTQQQHQQQQQVDAVVEATCSTINYSPA